MISPSLFCWPLRVYWEDTDASGVVYHANYLRWFERARSEWVRAHGLEQERLREAHIAFTVAGLEIDYLRPARLDDAVTITVALQERRRASLRFAQEVRRSTPEGEVLARARVRVACVDMTSFKPRALPRDLILET